MNEIEQYPLYMTHDQIIAALQRFYDILQDHHDAFQQEEMHDKKELMAALSDMYSDLFDPILCYKR